MRTPKGTRYGGRQKGTPNKATANVKAYAQQFTAAALDTLVAVMRDLQAPHQARNFAAVALLDRAHGKPAQAVDLGVPDGVLTIRWKSS